MVLILSSTYPQNSITHAHPRPAGTSSKISVGKPARNQHQKGQNILERVIKKMTATLSQRSSQSIQPIPNWMSF
jgi:hypothetical protein